ncbi:MAG: hypothetical protein U0Q07_01015 [Acidimicrobiales bacterium]
MASERDRLDPGDPGRADAWRRWGPYVAARQWGTVREDYSADGDAWRSSTFDEARSRAFRWGEDGLAAVCDVRQNLCLGVALWNGRDPILKERLFGLTGKEGNHGEDVKEHWWHLDATPSHSWLRWRYHYPQAEFPYQQLRDENGRRGFGDPEYELVDTGVFDGDRFWEVTVDHAKADPDDLCMQVTVRNAGPERDVCHVLAQLWCRNTWSWRDGEVVPVLAAAGDDLVTVDHPRLEPLALTVGPGPDGRPPTLLFCDNDTNVERLYGSTPTTAHPKDGIGDHVVTGAPTVDPDRRGTVAAAWYRVDLGPGEEAEVRVRLVRVPTVDPTVVERADVGRGFGAVMAERRAEADAFYAELAPADATDDERQVMRQAFAGLIWSKQLYRFDVGRWLDGDPAQPPPPPGHAQVRNAGWRHLDAADVLLMPDAWEYPWFATWDLAFHCVAMAHIDPELAKDQLLLLCREWYQHPNGQLPAYEWNFGDVNPPVHAWAAMRVFEIDGRRDVRFLKRIFHKLLLNFTWWVNQKDAEGNNVFEGGFLGLDNIGPFNRSEQLPVDGVYEQSDGSGWMAMYCLDLLEIAVTLARHDDAYEDVAVKFVEHFALIASAINGLGLWDEEDGFYYDVIRQRDGTVVPLKVRSMVGLVPLFAMAVAQAADLAELPDLAQRALWFVQHRPQYAGAIGRITDSPNRDASLLSVVSPERLRRVLEAVLDEDEFLSPYGLRSLSRRHLEHPAVVEVGGVRATVAYEPAESTSGLFGGNSNWRGPVWFPVNFLVIEALRRYHQVLGDDYTVELPTGSGHQVTLAEVADELARRLVALFLEGPDGRRPVLGDVERFQQPGPWHDLIPFFEYFHGDTGAGLGASHQTGWTALVADLITTRRWASHATPPADR